MRSIDFYVDDRKITAPSGVSVLTACLENDIYIPNLCYLKEDLQPETSCRLCFVALEGQPHPVAACSTPATAGLRVTTATPEVRRLQKSAFNLLLSTHAIACKTCPANRACELQRIARFLKVALKVRKLDTVLKAQEVVTDHPQLDYYPNRCVLCGRCIRTCHSQDGQAVLTCIKRGLNTTIGFFSSADNDTALCLDCNRCADVCPVKALMIKTDGPQI